MREVESRFESEELLLRSADYSKIGSFSLEVLKNFISGVKLEPFVPYTNPFDVVLPAQLFKGKGVTLLVNDSTIYSVSGLKLTELSLYDYSSGLASSITSGSPWQFLDMHTAWLLCNGSCTIFKYNQTMFNRPDCVLVQADTYIQACTYYRGRAVLGGFNKDMFWNPSWKNFWEHWSGQQDLGISLEFPFRQNFIWWSSIGGGDVLWLFYPELGNRGFAGIEGVHDECKPLIFDYMERNECGFMPMPWQGRVLSIQEVGALLLVCGEDGVSVLRTAPEPVPTLSLLENGLDVGISQPTAVCKGRGGALLLDTDGNLWAFEKGEFTKLGYRRVLNELAEGNVYISYAQHDDVFFISNGSSSFAFRKGLSKIGQPVYSVFYDGGIYTVSEEVIDTEGMLITDPLDFTIRGHKTINNVQVATDSFEGIYVSLLYRYDYKEDFTESDSVELNTEGIAHFGITALEFKVCVHADNASSLSGIDRIQVRYSIMDGRGIRGLYYADQAEQQ